MIRSRGVGRWLGRLALLLQVGMAGLPVVDGALFHRDAREQAVHLEAVGANCHAGDCVLGQMLQSGGEAFHDAAIPSLLGDVVLVVARPAAHPIVRRTNGIPVGPRAPPTHS
ncbi:MAG: hypothetical protein V9E87_05750 [Gemmatimonadales bacterium]